VLAEQGDHGRRNFIPGEEVGPAGQHAALEATVGGHGGEGVLKRPVVSRNKELTVEVPMATATQLGHARARASSAHFIGERGVQCFDAKEPVV
jgi:hypothetical protein